jgi:hypothetical protein
MEERPAGDGDDGHVRVIGHRDSSFLSIVLMWLAL